MAKANELVDAHINRVSLVKRGANQDPLRILKEDQSGAGLDLANINKSLGAVVSKSACEIVFFSAKADEDASALEKTITDLGLTIKSTLDTDNGTVFMIGDTVPEDVVIAEIGDNMFAAFTGLPIKKADLYPTGEEATDFMEVLGRQGAMPLASVALDALSTVVRNSIYSAKNSADAKSNISKAVRSLGAYLDAVVEMIPLTAFKAELMLEDGDDDVIEKAEDDPSNVAAAEDVADKKKPEDEKVEKTDDAEGEKKPEGEGEKAPVAEAKDDQPKADPVKEEPKTEQKSAGAADADAITAAVMKALDAKLAPVTSAVKEVADRVAQTEKSIQGTTIGGKGGDERTRTAKNDQPSGTDDFTFDTGFGQNI